ncbi:MAG: galactokinase family protein [Thermoguttaceae bacterium]
MIELGFAGVLQDRGDLAAALGATGLSPPACQSKADLFGQAAAALSAAGSSDGRRLGYFVPGRIEVLGKHTDYAGGRTMVAAIERGFCVAALPRDDHQVVVIDATNGETVVFRAATNLTPRAGVWANYPMTVARRVARNFPGATRGAWIAFASDLPAAAGMSSSSALIVSVFLALSEVNRLADRDEYWHNIGSDIELAGYLGAIENGGSYGTLAGDRGVGAFGGSEDQTAMLAAEPGRIRQFAYCPTEFEKSIPMPPGHVFAVATSGVAAEKTGNAMEPYNAASQLARNLVELWQRETGRADPHLAAALGSSPDAADRLRTLILELPSVSGHLESVAGGSTALDEETRPSANHHGSVTAAEAPAGLSAQQRALLSRLEHFILESGEIIPAACSALDGGDLRLFGRLVDRSQRAAEQLLGNQVRETVFLAASARRCGAAAASAFGAGFGGSVWAMIEAARAEQFLAAWSAQYHAEFPQHTETSRFFTTPAGPAAFRVC